MPSPKYAAGFTLVELMITIIVVGVLVSVGVPSFQNYIVQNRVKTGAQDLFLSLLYARSEAVKRNGDVYVIPADASAWEDGWIVTNNSSRTYSECQGGASDCLRVQQPLQNLTIDTAATQVTYSRNGRAGQVSSFGVCSAESDSAISKRVVTTELSGRPTIEYQGDCS